MADWSQPTVNSNYATEVLQDISARLDDAAQMFFSDPSNQPDHIIRYNRASNKFQEYFNAIWNDLILSIAGGGTGSSTAAGARTNLGLGTLATQNSNAVNITGGSVAASSLNGTVPTANLGSGTANNTTFLRGDQTWAAISSFAPGFIVAYGGAAAPAGWLMCDGAAISRTTYAALFATIGVTYGGGDGSTTFNTPNLQQRFPLGKATAGTGSVLGQTGGAIDHVHASATHSHTMGNHTHTLPTVTASENFDLHLTTSTNGAHTHGFTTNTTSQPGAGVQTGSSYDVWSVTNANAHKHTGTTGSDGNHSHTIDAFDVGAHVHGLTSPSGGPSTNSTDATTPGNTGSNNPPYLVVNFIIKT